MYWIKTDVSVAMLAHFQLTSYWEWFTFQLSIRCYETLNNIDPDVNQLKCLIHLVNSLMHKFMCCPQQPDFYSA